MVAPFTSSRHTERSLRIRYGLSHPPVLASAWVLIRSHNAGSWKLTATIWKNSSRSLGRRRKVAEIGARKIVRGLHPNTVPDASRVATRKPFRVQRGALVIVSRDNVRRVTVVARIVRIAMPCMRCSLRKRLNGRNCDLRLRSCRSFRRETMQLNAGTLLYGIISPLGLGGMGEVASAI